MSSNNYKINVNDLFEFENLDPAQLNMVPAGTNSFHIIQDHRSYLATVVHADYAAKRLTIKVNHNLYEVKIADQFDQLVKKLGLSSAAHTHIKEIKAPMPGLVLEVKVTAGDEVKKGDPLLILEAMKMENIIKSPGDGSVKIIHIAEGSVVDKGVLMIEME